MKTLKDIIIFVIVWHIVGVIVGVIAIIVCHYLYFHTGTSDIKINHETASENNNTITSDSGHRYGCWGFKMITVKDVQYRFQVFATVEPVDRVFASISESGIEIQCKHISPYWYSRDDVIKYTIQDKPECFENDGRWHGTQCIYKKNGIELGKFYPKCDTVYAISSEGVVAQFSLAEIGLSKDLILNNRPTNIPVNKESETQIKKIIEKLSI